jgi:hypothetical protein
MKLGWRWILIAAVSAGGRIAAQQPIRIDGPAKAEPTQLLRAAVAGPHDLVMTDSTRRLVIPRGTTLPRTTLIVGGNASVGAVVRGDVIVVGGDLFLQPGARIDGRAIAIGGGVYGSTLASTGEGARSFRDRTFDATRTADGLQLRYRTLGARDPTIELPLVEGLRVPSYDRVDGVSVPWGPLFRPSARVEVEPTVVYRSHVGAWDPGVRVLARAGDTWRLTMDARRGTFTNDAWIYSDLINSVNALFASLDTRNYFRADRVEAGVARVDRTLTLEFESYAGVMTERGWSVGSRDTLGARPWTIVGRGDVDNFARANLPIRRGRITSAIVAGTARWQYGDVLTTAAARIEAPWQAPGSPRFAQITFDGSVQFPTFGVQRFRSDIHVVATPGDTAPPQRFVHLGGNGTLPVITAPLSLAGDQLLFVDSRYEIPFPRLALPFIGAPTLALRHRVGSAGVQRLPRFVQNIGAMATLSFVRLEYSADPASRKQHVSLAVAFAR